MSVRVLVVALESEFRDKYRDEITGLGAECDLVPSLERLYHVMHVKSYSGLLLDTQTMLRAGNEEKLLIFDLMEYFPVARIDWHQASQQVRAQYYGQVQFKHDVLQKFVQEECARYPARPIRLEKRVQVHFNVFLSRNEDFEDQVESTVTMNVSAYGCFLFSTGDWKDVDMVWVKFKEFSDQAPISAEIRWRQPWGEALHVPGIGVTFRNVSKHQLQEFRTWV